MAREMKWIGAFKFVSSLNNSHRTNALKIYIGNYFNKHNQTESTERIWKLNQVYTGTCVEWNNELKTGEKMKRKTITTAMLLQHTFQTKLILGHLFWWSRDVASFGVLFPCTDTYDTHIQSVFFFLHSLVLAITPFECDKVDVNLHIYPFNSIPFFFFLLCLAKHDSEPYTWQKE